MARLSNDDINQLASFTEVTTTEATNLVAISFDYNYGIDGIIVKVDNEDAEDAGYTLTMPNTNTVEFSPAVPAGHTIRLQRETDIDAMRYTFTSGALFIASNIDADFKQIRKSQQEVSNNFDALSTNLTTAFEETKTNLTTAFTETKAVSDKASLDATTATAEVTSFRSLLAPVIVGNVLNVYTKDQIVALIKTGGAATTISSELVINENGKTQQQVNDDISFFNAVSVLSPAEKADIMLANPTLDLTAKAQLAIDTATAQGKICVFPYGTWNISMEKHGATGIDSYRSGIIINSNSTVSILPKCSLKAMRSNLGKTFMIGIVGDNVTLNGGGKIIGDRKIHDYTDNGGAYQQTHENVFGVFTTGENITIDNLIFREHTGDCILVCSDRTVREGVSSWQTAYHVSRNIKITNCVLDGARRNNISITDCEGFVISDNYIINAGIDDGIANGTNPKVGIDLEPYREANYVGNERVMNGVVSNNVFYNNALGACVCHNSYNISITANMSHGDAIKYNYSNNVSVIGNTFHYLNRGANSRSSFAISAIAPPSVDWYIGFNNVTVSGNTILDFPVGIDARGTGINITGNTVRGATTSSVSGYYLKNAKISENLFYDSFNGIDIKQTCENIDIVGNKFTNISNRGISAPVFGGVLAIKSNSFKQCLAEFYATGDNNKAVFSENTVDRTATTYGNAASLYFSGTGAELTASNNTFIAINGVPINTAYGASLKATNNSIDIISGGVFHNSTGKCLIDGNVFTVNNAATSNPSQAINVNGSSGAVIANNTVLGSPDGLRQFSTTIKTDTSTSSLIVYNTVTKAVTKHSSDIERGTTIIGKLYSASATYDPPSLTNGVQQSTTVTLTGAVVGDTVSVSFSQPLQGTRIWAEVTATNTITVYHRNDTGGTVDVASGTLTVKLI